MARNRVQFPPAANPAPPDGEQHESLGRLLAHYSAEHEELLASVQQCQERLDALAARLEGDDPGSDRTRSSGLDKLRRVMERLQLDQLRAEDRLTADLEGLGRSLRECQQQLAALSAHRAGETSESIIPPDREPCTVSEGGEARAVAERAMSRVEEVSRRIDELSAAAAPADRDTADVLARLSGDRDMLIDSVRKCEDRLASLATRIELGGAGGAEPEERGEPAGPALDQLTQVIDQLRADQSEAGAQARALAEQALARGDESCARVGELAAALRDSEAGAAEGLARLVADRDLLAESMRKQEERVTRFAAQLESIAAERAESTAVSLQLDELRQIVERFQLEQRDATATARAAAERAEARGEELSRRIEDVAADSLDWEEKAKRLMTLRAAVDAVAADGRRLEVRLEQVKSLAASPNKALPALVQRVAAIEARLERSLSIDGAAATQPGVGRDEPIPQAPHVKHGVAINLTRRIGAGPSVPWLRPAFGALLLTAVVALVAAGLWQDFGRPPAPDAARVQTVEPPAPVVQAPQPAVADAGSVPGAPPDSSAVVVAEAPESEVLPPVAGGSATGEIAPAAAPAAPAAEEEVPAAAAPEAEAAPAEAAAEQAADKASAVPPNLVALEPEGATACVVEPSEKRICVYRRTGVSITLDRCHEVEIPAALTWPRWLAATKLTPYVIRLADEKAQPRLAVVAGRRGAADAAIRIPAEEFPALSATIEPWKTSWIVRDENLDGDAVRFSTGDSLRAELEGWRQAWEQLQFDQYLRFYGASFAPQSDPDRETWRARKQRLFEGGQKISVEITAPSIFVVEHGTTAMLSFDQIYRSKQFASRSRKVMRWQLEGDRWVIGAETVLREDLERP